METSTLKRGLGALAIAAAAAMVAGCGGGDATPAASTQPPMALIAGNTGGSATGPVKFTVTFSADVGASFTADDIVVTNGVKGEFTRLSELQYTLMVTPSPLSAGTLGVSIAAGSYADTVGNAGLAASASLPFDTRAPELAIASSADDGPAFEDVLFTFVFSKDVGSAFTASDIAVTGGTKGKFTRIDGTRATLVVRPPANASGAIELAVPAGAVADAGGTINTSPVRVVQPFDTRAAVARTVVVGFEGRRVPQLIGFGGAEDSTVVADPTNAANRVGRVVKSATAELWAGTTIATCPNNALVALPFSNSARTMSVRVWSPEAGVVVRLKAENASDGSKSVETDATTRVAGGWQSLTFNFANPASGTPALDADIVYDKLSIFFDFGRTGAQAGGERVYYFDAVRFNGSRFSVQCPDPLPPGTPGSITFDEASTPVLTGFGGAEDSTVVADPGRPSNKVARVVKSANAELWAGTTVSTLSGYAIAPVDLVSSSVVRVRVWSPAKGIAVRLKVENASDPTKSVETEARTGRANGWQVLTFDFANPVSGTAAIDPAAVYDKMSIFFDFGRTGAQAGGERTYYFDNVSYTPGESDETADWPVVGFDTSGVSYTLTGFGGAEDSTVVADPAGGSNQVARVVKSATAELWAGTTVSTGANNSVPAIPLSATATRMTLRVYPPAAGIVVRLKVEDAADGAKSVETEATTTAAGAWQTLTFDFANPASGTAALNPATTYSKASVFFDFGSTGAQLGGARTYYFDDLTFLP